MLLCGTEATHVKGVRQKIEKCRIEAKTKTKCIAAL